MAIENENENVGDKVVEFIGYAWPPNVESYFIGLMEEEVKKGNRKTTTLSKAAWRHIKEEMKMRFGKEYSLQQFKNKFNQLRGRWKEFTSLLKTDTGIGYNSNTGQIVATDDQWKKLFDKHKFAKKYKKKGCLNYYKLCVIFGDTTTSAGNMVLSTKSLSISDDDDSDDDDDDSDKADSSGEEEDSYESSKDNKKRKAREDAHVAFANAMSIYAETTKKKLAILEKMSTSHFTMSSSTNAKGEIVGQQRSVQDKESLMTCLRALQGLEGIDGASFTKALKLLKEDPSWRDVFLTLSDERKKDLVLNLHHML